MTQPAYKLCPQCGQQADIHAPVCPRCSHRYRTQWAPAPSQARPDRRTFLRALGAAWRPLTWVGVCLVAILALFLYRAHTDSPSVQLTGYWQDVNAGHNRYTNDLELRANGTYTWYFRETDIDAAPPASNTQAPPVKTHFSTGYWSALPGERTPDGFPSGRIHMWSRALDGLKELQETWEMTPDRMRLDLKTVATGRTDFRYVRRR